MCYVGYTGPNCSVCDHRYHQLVGKGPCVLIPGATSSCVDGVKNGNEEDVDCGGPNCVPCATSLTRWSESHSKLLVLGVVIGGVVVVTSLVAAGLSLCFRARNVNKVVDTRVKRTSTLAMPTRRVVPTSTPDDDSDTGGIEPSVAHWLRNRDSYKHQHGTASTSVSMSGTPVISDAPFAANLVVDWSRHEAGSLPAATMVMRRS